MADSFAKNGAVLDRNLSEFVEVPSFAYFHLLFDASPERLLGSFGFFRL